MPHALLIRTLRRTRLAGAIAATTLAACGDPTAPGDGGTGDGGGTRRPVASVVVTPTSPSLEVGATRFYRASPRDADGRELEGRTVRWSSSDETIARVTVDGLVTAVAPGTAWIMAESEGRTGRAHIEVERARVADLQLSAIALELPAATSRVLAATPVDARGDLVPDAVVEYRVGDETIATVDPTGRVTGRSRGVTEVVVTAGAVTRRVRVAVTARAVAGRWTLAVSDLLGRGTRCTVRGVTLEIGQQAELLTGGARAGASAVECTIVAGTTPPYESPFAPDGTLAGGVTGNDVGLTVGRWRLDGTLTADGEAIVGTARYREEVDGALVERTGRFVASRLP